MWTRSTSEKEPMRAHNSYTTGQAGPRAKTSAGFEWHSHWSLLTRDPVATLSRVATRLAGRTPELDSVHVAATMVRVPCRSPALGQNEPLPKLNTDGPKRDKLIVIFAV